MLGNNTHVEPGDSAILEICLENKVRRAGMLIIGVVFAGPAQARKVNGIKERLERGVVARKQRQEFRHTGGFRKGEPKITIVNEFTIAFVHRVHNYVEFVSNITNSRFDKDFTFFHFIFLFLRERPRKGG